MNHKIYDFVVLIAGIVTIGSLVAYINEKSLPIPNQHKVKRNLSLFIAGCVIFLIVLPFKVKADIELNRVRPVELYQV
jgi:hypothetical protein